MLARGLGDSMEKMETVLARVCAATRAKSGGRTSVST